ncbi:MAG: ShlB/FhaC/HecB family hemolysin secretion/activation protein, partial [Deltaproteobacteria bacterium]|nr:ShlB/FhaC/HecB family hemolysin secretion/activation protein [Deltaproteobacteria bacterium]
MILQRPIGQNGRMIFFNAMGLFLFVLFFTLVLDNSNSTIAANANDMGAGVLITGFEFFRPNKPAESEDMAALKERRRQIEAMVRSEQDRQEKATERTRKNILAHIDFLQKSLKQIDDEISEEGDTLVPSHVLHQITADYKGLELSLEDMNMVADMVTVAYQEKGYILARAYVPEQEIEDGILRIAIVEGDVGDIKVSGQTYYDERVIKRNFTEQLRHGVIREELLEKGLLLTKELPNAETRVVLEKGEQPGTANIVLKTEDRLAFDWGIDFNNFGSEYVGKERYGTKMEITDPWWGSTLSLRGVTGNTMKESSLKSVDLSVPFSDYGTRLNLRYMEGSYVVGQELVDLGIKGDTKIYGLGISHPFLRKRNKNLTLSAGLENKFTRSYQL